MAKSTLPRPWKNRSRCPIVSGLWLSFYPFREAVYLEAVDALFPDVQDREALHREALQFALARGGRSGRTAQQFYRMRSGEIR